jgi:hypothetical protein
MKTTAPKYQQGSRAHGNITTKKANLPPRASRLLRALLARGEGITREEADRLAPASNGPHYVGMLRRRLSIAIPCYRITHITSDGVVSWYGLYRLTRNDRIRLRELGEIGE